MAAIDSIISTFGSALGGSLINSLNQSNAYKMMDRINEYNHPKNQLKRFAETGLNPARALSEGDIKNVSSDQSASDASGAFGAAASSMNNAIAASLAKESVKQAKEQTKLLKEQTISQELANQKARVQNEIDIDQLLGSKNLWTNVSPDGVVQYGVYDDEGGFSPIFDADGNYINFPEGIDTNTNFEIGRLRTLANRIAISKDVYETKRSKLEYQLREEFGDKEADALIRKMDAEAFSASQSGTALKLDNDFISGLGFGSKTADMLTRFLGVAVRVFGKK